MNKTRGFIPLDYQEKNQASMCQIAESFYKTMSTRRSVRDFSDKPIPPEVLVNAIKVAGTAPSGANMQPWHFVVVQSPEYKKRIREAAETEEKELYEHRASDEWLQALAPLGTDAEKPFLETAPALIAIFLKKFSIDKNGEKRKNYYTPESVGIATGFLIAALHKAGIATLTHTPSPMKFLSEILQRPAHERPFLLLVCGYPQKGVMVPNIEKCQFDDICTFV